MAKAYWIGRVRVHDPEQYKLYVAANGEAFGKFGARFLVRGAPAEALEGDAYPRNVVIEFPSVEAARECWSSPEYQRARALREGAAEVHLTLVEGYEPT